MASLLAWLPALAVAAANDCDVAVVGGGWAGLYTAYRLAPTTPNLCLFEARHKTGGRTYSVREEHNLTIDIGAYRFGRDMHLPGDLIRFDLNLSTRCYQPDCGLDPEFNTTPTRSRARRRPASAASTATRIDEAEPDGRKKNPSSRTNYWFTGYQGTPCCWAEQSLKVAEHILKTHFALPKPAWLDGAYYRHRASAL
ncbi:flavin containing amine oxidoreductase [Aureococcus anophagefferens]|nr:flavin containing amine oxidoreductase [Aureococcus anophagefferens]